MPVRTALHAPAVGAAAALAWAPALAGAFRYDDLENVVHDGATLHPLAIGYRLLHGVRPLLRASYALDHALWGPCAFGFLLTNLALHVATTIGVLVLARRRLGSEAAAAVAALLFALQPAAGEVVAYVSGRSTGLMAALVVWGLVAHAGAGPFAAVSRSHRRAAALALFAAACLAKEVAIAFPLLVAVWDRSAGPGEPPGAVPVRWLVATAAGALAVCAVSAHYRGLLAFSLGLRDPATSLVVNVRALPEQLALLVRPDLLSIIQPFDPGGHGGVALGAAVVLGLLAVALLPRGLAPHAALAAGWLLVALLPTQSVIAKTEVVTAKPLYLAWMGPAILLAGVLRTRLVAAVVVVAGLACVREARVWADEVTLWTRAVERAPRDPVAWNDLGEALLAAHRPRAAAAAFARAVELDPADLDLRDHAHLARLLCNDLEVDP